jgi:hypothetical protein
MSLTVAEAAPVISPVPALATDLDEDDDGDPRVRCLRRKQESQDT